MARKIEIEIVGDTKGLSKAFNKAADDTNTLGSAFTKFGKAAVVGLGAVGVGAAAAGVKMVGMASDAEEVRSKMEVVFGKALPGLTKEIDKFSQATGTSRFEMREQAANMGALLEPMLGNKQGAADMALQFTKLATDLGSFNNIPTAEALEKIRAGLVGESEPLRSLGVLLTEASTKEYAYANGIAKRGAELTEVQKVEARAGQIMQQTALAQGDATRTAGSMANQMKMLKSSISDTATEIGLALLPAALSVVSTFNDNWPKIKEIATVVFDALMSGASTLVGVLRTHWDSIVATAISAKDKIAAALQAIQTVAEAVWPKVLQAAKGTANWYKDNLEPTITSVSKNIAAAWDKMGRDIATGTDKNFGEGGGALGVLGTRLDGMKSLVNAFLAALRGDWGEAWGELKNAVKQNLTAMVDTFKGIWGAILNAAKQLGQKAMDGLRQGLSAGWSAVSGWLTGIPGRVASAVGDLSSTLWSAGYSILQGLWDGLKAKWEQVKGWLNSLAEKIPGEKGPPAKDAKILEPAGKLIMLGLETGMMAGWAALAPKINALGGKIIENYILGIESKAPEFKGKMAQAATDALEAARAAVEAAQGRVADAFGRMGDMAKRAFEAKTQGLMDKLSAQFDTKIGAIEAFQRSLTPSELALRELDKAEQENARTSAVLAAEKAVATARMIEDAEQRKTALIAAEEQLRVAQLAVTRAGLEERAAVERQDRDNTAALQIKHLEDQKARELQNLEERRSQLSTKLDEQLAVLVKKLAEQPKEYGKTMQQITKLLASYGVTLKNSGETLGEAFAQGLRNAGKDVTAAVKYLAKIVANYLELKSPAKEGPLSNIHRWWKPMGPMLASQMSLGGGGIASRSAAMAGAGVAASRGGGGGWPERIVLQVDGRTLTEVVRKEMQRINARN